MSEPGLDIDFAALRDFVASLRASGGWLVNQCGTPVAIAVGSASMATEWYDDAVDMFANRWDFELSGLSSLVHMFARGIEDSIRALEETESSIAGD